MTAVGRYGSHGACLYIYQPQPIKVVAAGLKTALQTYKIATKTLWQQMTRRASHICVQSVAMLCLLYRFSIIRSSFLRIAATLDLSCTQPRLKVRAVVSIDRPTRLA